VLTLLVKSGVSSCSEGQEAAFFIWGMIVWHGIQYAVRNATEAVEGEQEERSKKLG
jgi:hypothetical protein